MFYYIMGELAYKDLNTCVIDCSGVGYKLTVSQITSESLASYVGKKVKLFTYLAVREDGIELFGFGTDDERVCFNRLTSVSGVGPKVAMSILSVLPPEALATAICSEDIKSIAKAPGIGSKTAARIVLELKDKISKDFSVSDFSALATSSVSKASTARGKNFSEATEALMVLGYDKNTILNVLKDVDTNMDVGEIIRVALKKLSR
ncbi:MAG: Holliday junction branch migration protein RuvA [Clostridia bacterium]|nr:Holliday junction branch migration protein RuvA [Clostridia bacterium]